MALEFPTTWWVEVMANDENTVKSASVENLDVDRLEYMCDTLGQFKIMAVKMDCDVLAYLLEITILEAELQRELAQNL